jgi:hypothetical protein
MGEEPARPPAGVCGYIIKEKPRAQQPEARPPNRKKVHVNKILPPPWGLLGATWRLAPSAGWGTRSTRSHLGKRPEHEIPDFCSRRGGPGGVPRSGPGLPETGWGPRGLGFESVPGGIPIGSTGGGRGRPKERRPRRAKMRLKS